MQNQTALRARSKRVAAVAAAGLVATTLGALGTGTAHAESAALNYTCTVPILGDQTFTVVSDTTAPAKVATGRTISPVTKATVTIPENVVGALYGLLGARTGSGTAEVDAIINGATQTINMKVPKTDVPDSGSMDVIASGKGQAIKVGKAGSKITMAASDFVSNLTFVKEDGSEAMAAEIPCTLDSGQNATVDTIRVVKANSKTMVKPVFMRKKNRLRTVNTVRTTNSPVKAKGKVRVVVKRNGKQIRKQLVKVNPKGKAVAAFAKMPKKGNFVIISRYMGSPKVKASQKRVVRKLK